MADKEKRKSFFVYWVLGVLAVLVIAGAIFLLSGAKESVSSANISITYKISKFSEVFEVKNISLPIDSGKEACYVWEQAFERQFVSGYGYNCSTKVADGNSLTLHVDLLCPPNYFKCFGYCDSKMLKVSGNIEDAFCYLTFE